MKQKIILKSLIVLILISCNNMETKNKIEKKEKLKFPIEYTEKLTSEMKTSFWKCNDDSHINSALHYYIVIPNNVKPTSLMEKNIVGIDTIKEIATYKRIDDKPYLEIQVVYEPLTHEINPSDWLYNLLKITKEKIINKREVKGNAGIYLDALTSKVMTNGEEVISRTTAPKKI